MRDTKNIRIGIVTKKRTVNRNETQGTRIGEIRRVVRELTVVCCGYCAEEPTEEMHPWYRDFRGSITPLPEKVSFRQFQAGI